MIFMEAKESEYSESDKGIFGIIGASYVIAAVTYTVTHPEIIDAAYHAIHSII